METNQKMAIAESGLVVASIGLGKFGLRDDRAGDVQLGDTSAGEGEE